MRPAFATFTALVALAMGLGASSSSGQTPADPPPEVPPALGAESSLDASTPASNPDDASPSVGATPPLVPPLPPSPPLSTPPPTPPPTRAERASILVLDLAGSGIEDGQLRAINNIMGQSVGRYPALKVLTADDVRRLADLDAAKEVLGCDQASCMAQIAGDFGARYVVYGTVAALGDLIVIQVTLFDGDKAEVLRRSRVETRELNQLTTQIDLAVDEVLGAIVAVNAPVIVDDGVHPGVWVTAGGATALAAGVVLVAIGTQPLLAHNQAVGDVDAAEAAFNNDNAAALAKAKDAHAAATVAIADWDSYGALSTAGGAIAVVVGTVAVVGGALWWSGVLGSEE